MSQVRRIELTTLLSIAGLAALVALIYAESFGTMVEAWAYSTHRHGWFVFPISGYLLWRLRRSLADVDLKPWPWGVGVLLALVLLWLLARTIGVQAVEHFATMLLIPAVIATCLGVDLVKRALFPLLFLLLAVPVGDAMVPYLMRITADVAAVLLRIAGVPVFREGQFMTLPGGDFEVAEVCSGLRYLVAGTVVALLFSYLTYRSNRKRLIFVVAAATGVLLVNGVRAFVVMFVASATDMRVLAGEDHIYFGWFLFAAAIGAALWIGSRYGDDVPFDDRGPPSELASPRTQTLPIVLVFGLLMLAITARPLGKGFGDALLLLLPIGAFVLWAMSRVFVRATAPAGYGSSQSAGVYRRVSSAVVVSAAFGVLLAGSVLTRTSVPPVPHGLAVELPALPRCDVSGPWSADWQPQLQSPDFEVSGRYRCAGQGINVFVGGYLANSQGRELISDRNRLMPDGWQRFAVRSVNRFEAHDGHTIKVVEVRAQSGDLDSLVWYWYAVGKKTTTWPIVAKTLQGLQVIARGYADGSVYVLQTTVGSSPEAGRQHLRAVAREIEERFAPPRLVETAAGGDAYRF